MQENGSFNEQERIMRQLEALGDALRSFPFA